MKYFLSKTEIKSAGPTYLGHTMLFPSKMNPKTTNFLAYKGQDELNITLVELENSQ